MRRVLLLCLLSIASASMASAQASQHPHKIPEPFYMQPPSYWPKVHPQNAQQHPPSKPGPCKTTAPSGPYPSLTPPVKFPPYIEYSGRALTWTPIGNESECHIRQLYFFVATVYGNAPNGAGPDINIYMTRHGETELVKQPLAWDIVAIQEPGGTLYRVDAQQSASPADPNGLQGDFDFVIDVIGTPAKK